MHGQSTVPSVETELRSCVKVEVDVQGSRSLIAFMVFVDVKQNTELEWRVAVHVAE